MENMEELAGENNRLKALLAEKDRQVKKLREDVDIAENKAAAAARAKQTVQQSLDALTKKLGESSDKVSAAVEDAGISGRDLNTEMLMVRALLL